MHNVQTAVYLSKPVQGTRLLLSGWSLLVTIVGREDIFNEILLQSLALCLIHLCYLNLYIFSSILKQVNYVLVFCFCSVKPEHKLSHEQNYLVLKPWPYKGGLKFENTAHAVFLLRMQVCLPKSANGFIFHFRLIYMKITGKV